MGCNCQHCRETREQEERAERERRERESQRKRDTVPSRPRGGQLAGLGGMWSEDDSSTDSVD